MKRLIAHHRSEAEAWALSAEWWAELSEFTGVTFYLVEPVMPPHDVDDVGDPIGPMPERSHFPIDEEIAAGLSIPWPPADDWLANLPMIGDIQVFEGVEWRSLIDNNVWSPSASPSSWERVTEPTEVLPWEPWTSGLPGDLYQIGARVTHNGSTWVATVGNNHWEPGVFGWTEEG